MKLEKNIIQRLCVNHNAISKMIIMYLYLHLGHLKSFEHGRIPCLSRIKENSESVISLVEHQFSTYFTQITRTKENFKYWVLQCIGP